MVEQLIKQEQVKIKTLKQAAQTERLRAEQKAQRAEKLAQRLRAMGINPKKID